jgi:hypothetical protein
MFAPLSVARHVAVESACSNTDLSSAASILILAVFSKTAATARTKQKQISNNHQNPVSKWASVQHQKLSNSPLLLPKKQSPSPPPRPNIFVMLYHLWFRLPQIFRFFVAGNLGNIGFFYTEQLLFDYLSTNPHGMFSLEFLDNYLAGVSFFTAYSLQIVTTHLLFALLVYGLSTVDTPEKYLKTLSGQFRVYFISLVGSTILNTHLIGRGVDKTVAFFGTMAVFACINYVLISWIVRRAVASSDHTEQPASKSGKNIPESRSKTSSQSKKETEENKSALGGWFVDKIQRGGALFGVGKHYGEARHSQSSLAFVGQFESNISASL